MDVGYATNYQEPKTAGKVIMQHNLIYAKTTS